MLSITTAIGTVQFHRYEHIDVRRPAQSETEIVRVGDLIDIDGLKIKLTPRMGPRVEPAPLGTQTAPQCDYAATERTSLEIMPQAPG